MNRRRVGIAALVVLALLAVVLFTVNVRAAFSTSRAESTVSTGSTRPPATEPNGGHEIIAELFLYVEGDDPTTTALRRSLQKALETQAGLGPISMLSAPPKAENHPVVVAAVSEHDVLWTPVYGRARVRASFAYSSDKGDISWRDTGPFVFADSDKSPLVRSRGYVDVVDETRGLISRPAYREYLGRLLGDEVSKQVKKVIEGAAGGR